MNGLFSRIYSSRRSSASPMDRHFWCASMYVAGVFCRVNCIDNVSFHYCVSSSSDIPTKTRRPHESSSIYCRHPSMAPSVRPRATPTATMVGSYMIASLYSNIRMAVWAFITEMQAVRAANSIVAMNSILFVNLRSRPHSHIRLR